MDCLLLDAYPRDKVGVAFPRSKMDDSAAREDACQEYQSSLEDLTFNSKPHINMLTILAEENVNFAKDIVAIIEAQISKAPAAEKLPVLYLVDSIVKNVGGEYLAVFAKNLITSFICVFEKVDENTRKSLFKLRSTWDEIFPLKKLYALDVRVNSVDPAWPIKPLPPTVNASIHVNPKFLKQSEEAPSRPTPSQLPPPVIQSSLTQEQMIRQQLLAKQKQLLELQQKKIELELEQTKAQLVGGFSLLTPTPVPLVTSPKPVGQPTPVVRPMIAPQPPSDPKLPTRDPRLNRIGPPGPLKNKAQPAEQKEVPPTIVMPVVTPEKRAAEKTLHSEKGCIPRKDEKLNTKSPPITKNVQIKNKHPEVESHKSTDSTKKDPRLKKRVLDKAGDGKDDEQKEKKRCSDKRDESARFTEVPKAYRGRLQNGLVTKREHSESAEKVGGNARTHARKRTRSRSKSRSPNSPKRKGRRSPKSRTRSTSLSPSPSHKAGKPRRFRGDEPAHGKNTRDDRPAPKKNQVESRRSKTPVDERKPPVEERKPPVEERKPPVEERKTPVEERKTPVEERKTPVEERKLPVEERKLPVEERKLPVEERKLPVEERKTPVGERKKPVEERRSKTPVNERRSSSRTPVDERRSSSKTPVGERRSSSKTPVDERRSSSKTLVDERRSKSRESPRSHDGGSNQAKDPLRWRSGWDENKHLKPGDSHTKQGPQRHKTYNTPTRPTTPRTPKHRLSVDANLQIPEVLNSASKKDLLRRASKSLESGEISQEDFLNMAHKIKNFFQYQEEKQQHPENWDAAANFSARKTLLAIPPEPLDQAQLTYFEHKSKLRKTQVAHRTAGEDWDGLEECEGPGRAPRDQERRSIEREESRPPLAPMIEEYNHGKEFPALKSLPGLRFRRRADPRESSEREWNSPLTERQREEQKSGYDAPRRYAPSAESRHPDPRRLDGPSHPSGLVVRNCPSPCALETPLTVFERERLSPLHQKDMADMSPVPRFESPNSEHSDDGPLPSEPLLAPQSILQGPVLGALLSNIHQSSNSPGHTPPHEGGPPLPCFDAPGNMGPSRPNPPGWYNEQSHFESLHTGRPIHHNMPERFNGPHIPQGPLRSTDNMGRFDGHLGPQRFDVPGPGHFDNAVQCFDNNLGPGPVPMGLQQQRPIPFENPALRLEGSVIPICYEAPGQPGPRFDLSPQGSHFDGPTSQQGPLRFTSIPMGPMPPPMYDNNIPPHQNFPMAQQPFPDAINPQFHPAPMAFSTPPSLQPTANFNILPGPAFSQPGADPFFNPAVASVNMQPTVNVLNMNQPFLPQNPAPFAQPVPQMPPTENHFGQVDVNDLLSKLVSTGIIKGSQPETTAPMCELPSAGPEAPPVEEEEEDEVEDDFPDLTNFKLDDMKQRYESVVTKLYSGNQCCLCSMRFTAAQTDLYADHLDWHFRQNHAGKVAGKKITHRRWYYGLTDWIEFEEIADLEERAKSLFFEKETEEEVQKNQAAAKEKEFQSVKAAKDQVAELCEICQEPFETYWVEEEEDWFLKNAIRVDDKNFHPSCFEDYKNTSLYMDVTPSPNKVLSEHPLGIFIKAEKDDNSQCCTFEASIKQEADPEEGEGEQPAKRQKVEELLLTDLQSEEDRL
ncbi:pre-mRNA cleavage complex 2 protein Pcf11 isoform X2 [Hippocampus zosterae]|uniref:pre-mRNA cleavage complex 2 protein Pcf11 isoform X2 n=1 Tax=Hippocampus zosterae TaxID=109293 RepID=UPI00223DDECB|nr:pre-mRNA cleavage complex 2 protein Pcf11 isoform X2 [Hippocampus zosterae]